MKSRSGDFCFCENLRSSLGQVCEITDSQCETLAEHYELLVRWNQRMNLTSVRDPAEMIQRHYCESVFLAAHLPAGPLSVIDVGSGAGFPGIGVAAVRHQASVTLVESNRRKAVFLRESTRSFRNVRVCDCRAEQLGERFDWLVSRGVAWGEFPLLADHVALLGTEPEPDFPWRERIRLPWGDRRVLLIGDVPRGTGEQDS